MEIWSRVYNSPPFPPLLPLPPLPLPPPPDRQIQVGAEGAGEGRGSRAGGVWLPKPRLQPESILIGRSPLDEKLPPAFAMQVTFTLGSRVFTPLSVV